MNYKTKKDILNFILLPVFAVSHKLAMYIRGIFIHEMPAKLKAIKKAVPDFSYWTSMLLYGGSNFALLIHKKYIIKIKKNYQEKDAKDLENKKKLIDIARHSVSDIEIPNTEIIKSGKFKFVKYNFIKGKNLNQIPIQKLSENRIKLGKQLGKFIYELHNAGVSHNDLSNNILVNPKTMDVVGIIDWEFVTKLSERTDMHDFYQLNRNNENKIKQSNIVIAALEEYYRLKNEN